MRSSFLCFFILSIHSLGYSQSLSFSDPELKRYLITEMCIDTNLTDNNGWWNGSMDADLDDDGEISQHEAMQITNIGIQDHTDAYNIKTIQDLSQFSDLTWLQIINVDSIRSISNLGLDSLHSLWIGANRTLDSVDISDLVHLTKDLRVEDIDTLSYLNIQNGSVAQYFSLFYTEHIHSACIDSIAREYEEVQWRMISGLPAVDSCSRLTSSIEQTEPMQIDVYPNPSTGEIKVHSPLEVLEVKIYGINGKLISKRKPMNNQIDISSLASGLYQLQFITRNGSVYRKIVKR